MTKLATLDTTIRQTAFELWALKCNRQMKRVKVALFDLGHDVDLSTLNGWALEERWPEKVKTTFEQLMPDVDARTWSTMALAGEEAADYMRNVINGNFRPEVSPDEQDDEDPFNDPAFARIRVEAAKQVLLMTGWSPSGGFTKEKPKDPYNLRDQDELAKLPMSELERRELEIVEKIEARKQEQELNNRRSRRNK